MRPLYFSLSACYLWWLFQKWILGYELRTPNSIIAAIAMAMATRTDAIHDTRMVDNTCGLVKSMASASASLPDGVPQANCVDQDDATEVVSNVAHPRAAIRDGNVTVPTPTPTMPSSSYPGAAVPSGLFANLRKFFNPRATDINQLLTKLQTQFKLLEVEHKKYLMMRTRSST